MALQRSNDGQVWQRNDLTGGTYAQLYLFALLLLFQGTEKLSAVTDTDMCRVSLVTVHMTTCCAQHVVYCTSVIDPLRMGRHIGIAGPQRASVSSCEGETGASKQQGKK